MHIRAFLLAAAALVTAAPALAVDLTVYSGGAVKTGLSEAVDRFTKTQHVTVNLVFLPMGPMMKKLEGGLATDVVVLAKERMDEAVRANYVPRETVTPVGTVAMGVAVHTDAKAPDISTPEKFKAALLAAKSIVYIDPKTGTSGKHFAKVLDTLGIRAEIDAKATLGTGGYVVAPVGKGEIEMGVHQITEILPVPGVKVVGVLPPPLGLETTYLGGVTTGAKKPALAKALLAYLRSDEVRALFKERGFIEK